MSETRHGTPSDEGSNARRVTRRDVLGELGAVAAAGSAAAWLAGCADQADRTRDAAADASSHANARSNVSIYVSADDVLARDVFAAEFMRSESVSPVFDTEATKTTGLERRLIAERNRPRADLFWSSEGFAVVRLARAGVLRPFTKGGELESVWSAWPEAHRDPEKRWIAFAARARVVVTRTDRADVEPPASWADLARPGLAKGSAAAIAIADPRFGTTCCHLSALEVAWRDAAARGIEAPSFDAWLDGMRANGVRVLTGGNSATVEAVATGECAFGLTDSDDALAAIARGLPLRMSLPRTLPAGVAGGGTMLIPNTVSLISGGPADSASAERVAALLVSPECEALIERSASRNLPLGRRAPNDGVANDRASAHAFDEPDPMRFDLADAAERAHERAIVSKRRLEGRAAEATSIGNPGGSSS